MSGKAKWTFMVYIAGDNDLTTAGEIDLEEMRSVGSTDGMNIAVVFDSEGNRGTQRFPLRRNGMGEVIEDLGEQNSGSPECLTELIGWAGGGYPAERYALILWTHGGGWEPTEMERIAREVGARSFNVREAHERSKSRLGRIFFRTTLKEILSRPCSRGNCHVHIWAPQAEKVRAVGLLLFPKRGPTGLRLHHPARPIRMPKLRAGILTRTIRLRQGISALLIEEQEL